MASFISSKNVAILALALALCVQGIVGGAIECANLNKDSCAFAVSSSGKLCVLEKSVKRSGEETYTCRASEIEADKLKDWVGTDHCIDACGLERSVLGISSDSLLEAHFLQKLCSAQCYNGCPNIVDLYFNLAAGEGVFLPKLCEAKGENGRRGLAEGGPPEYIVAPVAPEAEGGHPVKYINAPVAPEAEGGHPVKYIDVPVASEGDGGHPVKYITAPVAPEAEGGHPVKYITAPVAPEAEGGHPVKYITAPVAPEAEGGHPVKYITAPVAPEAEGGHPVKYIPAPVAP